MENGRGRGNPSLDGTRRVSSRGACDATRVSSSSRTRGVMKRFTIRQLILVLDHLMFAFAGIKGRQVVMRQ